MFSRTNFCWMLACIFAFYDIGVCASVSRGTSQQSSNTAVFSGIKFMLGKCEAAHYYEKAQNCSNTFFKTMRQGSVRATNCSEKYTVLKQCMLNTFKDCMKNSLQERHLSMEYRLVLTQNYLKFFGDEKLWCEQGGLAVPKYVHAGTTCDNLYGHIAKGCVETYQLVFNSSASLQRLCREYISAKTCLHQSLVNHCSFSTSALTQMIEQYIEAEANFQPFCQRPIKGLKYSFNSLIQDDTCPPHAHADVLFVVDVSRETTNQDLASMKKTIARVTNKLDYGKSGTRVAYAQFHERAALSIGMDRYPTKRSFIRGLARHPKLRSTPQTSQRRRFLGRSLKRLANVFSRDTGRITRPFHTPVCIVLTTGQSDDVTSSVVETMIRKKIHLVRLGPTFADEKSPHYNVTYHVPDSNSFTRFSQIILQEICRAERKYNSDQQNSVVTEHISPSLLAPRNRIRTSQLPLLWVPKELVIREDDSFNNTNTNAGLPPTFEESIFNFSEFDV